MDKTLLNNRIEELTKDFSLSKYNFLKISYLVRLINETSHFSSHCKTCAANEAKLEALVEEIPFLNDIEHRQPYENQFNAIRKHFHGSHAFIPPHYFSSRLSVIGIIAGISLAAIIARFFAGNITIDTILAGFVIGLAGGYSIGAIKEMSFRKEKKII
jgi:hypothetical protein